jgi:hypothetical protein
MAGGDTDMAQELYFEMEFPSRDIGQDNDNISFSSKSIESFGSELTNPDSRYVSWHLMEIIFSVHNEPMYASTRNNR